MVKENIREMTIPDVFVVLKEGMEFVERLPGLSGTKKKEMVVQSLNTLIDRNVFDESIKQTFKRMIAPTIDAICEVSKREWNINLKPSKLCCFA